MLLDLAALGEDIQFSKGSQRAGATDTNRAACTGVENRQGCTWEAQGNSWQKYTFTFMYLAGAPKQPEQLKSKFPTLSAYFTPVNISLTNCNDLKSGFLMIRHNTGYQNSFSPHVIQLTTSVTFPKLIWPAEIFMKMHPVG